MVNNMTMIVVNIYEAKAKLSEYLDVVGRGERVLICKRNRPVAELHPVGATRTEPRAIGLAKGLFAVPDSFFAPLPDDVLDEFEGAGSRSAALRVADAPSHPGYGVRKRRGPHSR